MLRLSFFSEHKVFDTSLFSSCVREKDLKKPFLNKQIVVIRYL